MIGALALAWLAAAPASAQVGIGTGVGPDAFLYSDDREKKKPSPIMPMGLAVSLAFDATTWAAVQASTNPAADLSALVKRGYYKLELIEAVLVASKAKAPLKAIVALHDKGKTLREVAKTRDVDFDPLYEEALRVDERVTGELLPEIMSVRGAPKEQAQKPPRERKRRRVPKESP